MKVVRRKELKISRLEPQRFKVEGEASFLMVNPSSAFFCLWPLIFKLLKLRRTKMSRNSRRFRVSILHFIVLVSLPRILQSVFTRLSPSSPKKSSVSSLHSPRHLMSNHPFPLTPICSLALLHRELSFRIVTHHTGPIAFSLPTNKSLFLNAITHQPLHSPPLPHFANYTSLFSSPLFSSLFLVNLFVFDFFFS